MSAMDENPSFPDMDRPWQEMVREAPRIEAEQRPWTQQQVCDVIRRARRGHSHMTSGSWFRSAWAASTQRRGGWRSSRNRPRFTRAHFAAGYEALGFSRREIQAIKHALDDGSWTPCCHWCGSRIDVMVEGFCVRRTDITEYFGLDVHDGRKPPKWMKDAILRGFGGRCAGCRKRLTVDNATLDHIVAKSKGGLTEMTNL